MKQLVAIVMIAFLVPATATVAFAKNPCKDDKAKFCKDAKAAGKKVNDCLKEHISEVSPACKEQLEKPKEPKTDQEKAERKIKNKDKERPKAEGEKPAETKPAETKPTETAPSDSAPPAPPGGAEDKQ
jgi:FtsZ-interacting cell division protein ZipA